MASKSGWSNQPKGAQNLGNDLSDRVIADEKKAGVAIDYEGTQPYTKGLVSGKTPSGQGGTG